MKCPNIDLHVGCLFRTFIGYFVGYCHLILVFDKLSRIVQTTLLIYHIIFFKADFRIIYITTCLVFIAKVDTNYALLILYFLNLRGLTKK